MNINLLNIIYVMLAVGPAFPIARGSSEGPSSTQSSDAAPDQQTIEALGEIEKLLAENVLRLSTDGESAARRFHFLVRLGQRVGDTTTASYYLVEAHADRYAILVSSKEGLPYCFMTNGLFVMLDHAEPGRLLIFEAGNPRLSLTTDDDGAVFIVSYVRRPGDAGVRLDVEALLRAALPNARAAVVDRIKGAIAIHTTRGSITVTQPSPDQRAGFGVNALVITSRSGTNIVVSDIRVDAAPRLDLLSVTRQVVAETGVSTRMLNENELQTLQLLVPADFGRDPKEAESARKLLQLFAGHRRAAEQN